MKHSNTTPSGRELTNSPISADEPSVPIGLSEFCRWVSTVAELPCVPEPTDSLEDDLAIDDFGMILLVSKLDQLVYGEAWVRPHVYEDVATVRDLYLFYLQMLSMPR